MNDIYNTHTHVFTGNCAPKDFLQVGIKLGDGASRMLKWLFLSKPISWIVKHAGNMIPNKKLQFLKIGVMASQELVFKNLLENYAGSQYSNIKVVALTIDMDYMTDGKNKPNQNFDSQIQEMVKLKKAYPNNLFPFYGIDPRNPDTLNIEKLKVLIENKTFSGIKIYPPKGFFPFDPRLDNMYKYAEENNIPVMTHCTRSGSYYVGKEVWSLILDAPHSLNSAHPAMSNIRRRIAAYKNTMNKEFKENGRVCNLFSHPENYVPVLAKYPKLKLCLAHLGGGTEMLGKANTDKIAMKLYEEILALEGASTSWYDFIKNSILKDFTNTYTDISYTLSEESAMKMLGSDLAANAIPADRVLFGTDYFMVQQEESELNVIKVAEKHLGTYLEPMMSTNVKNYLY